MDEVITPNLTSLDLPNKATVSHGQSQELEILPISIMNHPVVKAGLSYIEKINSIRKESMLSTSYSLHQSDALLRHFVNQCHGVSNEQSKASQLVLAAWCRLIWNPDREEPVEKISKVANYCIKYPHDQSPIVVLLYRVLIDIVDDFDHPLQETLNQIKFILSQQGLLPKTPFFLETQPDVTITKRPNYWYKNLFLPIAFCVSLSIVSQIWIYITWQILLT